MKINTLTLVVFSLMLITSSCGNRKKDKVADTASGKTITRYRASVTILNDLVHTKLDLEPDFDNKELKGEVQLLLKPHFYPVDSLILNAKCMRIESVELLQTGVSKGDNLSTINGIPLQYVYDSLFLRIALNRRYTSSETYTVKIKYVAMPEKNKAKGSQAITDSKGVYFIAPDEKEPNKPIQVWTQGETEAASAWFPTIDAPNQKTSEEMAITVPKKYKTVSNGKYNGSIEFLRGRDSMRIDYWVQDKPHAPYLFALAIGEFAEIKDNWHDMPVNYYVEPEYAQYARLVFGNTPEMIEFFSNKLKTPFVWDKYHQIVVRDFVSGAMENTSCVIHFDKLQHNSRQHLDQTYEDVISHELFHHWFGDLVTCESWSNLPLNESFATYGEYLWDEYKYGRDEADAKMQRFRETYFSEADYDPKKLIRYDYETQEEMFDAHSYQKGGLVLHELRKYVGDDAFFESLRLYLQRYRFKTAEIADLRTCFEEVSGEDLNWFFDQWFFRAGHPKLDITQTRNGSDMLIKVKQTDKIYRLPFDIAIGKERVQRVWVDKDTQTFVIHQVGSRDMLVFDGENQFLGEITIHQAESEWQLQFEQAKIAYQKIEAFDHLIELYTNSGKKADLCQKMLNESFYKCREMGMESLYTSGILKTDLDPLKQQIIRMGTTDPKSSVRYEAIRVLSRLNEEDIVKQLLADSSYMVAKRAMLAYGSLNRTAAFQYFNNMRDEKDPLMQDIIYSAIGRYSDANELPYFLDKIRKGDKQQVLRASNGLSAFVGQNHTEKLDIALDSLQKMYHSASSKQVKSNAKSALKSLRNFYYYEIFYANYFITNNRQLKKQYKARLKSAETNFDKIDAIIKSLQKT